MARVSLTSRFAYSIKSCAKPRFARRTISAGLSLLGPVLLEHGTPAQKAQHLPKIARNESFWCQGYSEPGSGSDLASLSTRADLEGDEFVVNGQKIWTSHADTADWMFCLVRTDREAPPARGHQFFCSST